MSAPVLHARSLRLYVNAGMSMPVCYSRGVLLDTDKARLPMAKPGERITCKRCRRFLDLDGVRQ